MPDNIKCVGRKKTAVAVAHCKAGHGLFKVKALTASQIYSARQTIAKALVAYNQKCVDRAAMKDVKEILGRYDHTLLVADPCCYEPKKFGNRGTRTRTRFPKLYR